MCEISSASCPLFANPKRISTGSPAKNSMDAKNECQNG